MKRQRASKGHRRALQPSRAISRQPVKLVQQARLADARFAGEQYGLSSTLLDLRQQILEHGHLARARDERTRMAIDIDETHHAPEPVRLWRGRKRLDLESPFQKRLRRRRRHDRLTLRRRQQLIEDALRAEARVGVQLDAIVEPADQHLLGVQGASHLHRWRRCSRCTACPLHGERGVRGVSCRVLDDVEAERRSHERGPHLDDATAEARDLRGDLIEHSRALVLRRCTVVGHLRLEERHTRPLPSDRRAWAPAWRRRPCGDDLRQLASLRP